MRIPAVLMAAPLIHAAEVKPFNELPDVNRIWIAMEEGSIRPADFQQIRSESDAPLLVLKPHGSQLKRGDVWAVVDPDLIELERRSLEVDRKKVDRQSEKIREDTEDARRRMLLESREIEGKIDALTQAIAGPDFPETMRESTQQAIREMTERVEILKKRTSAEAVEDAVRDETEELTIQLERKHRQFEQLERRARLTALSDGELRIGDSLQRKLAERKSDTDTVIVDPSESLATIVNESRLEIIVQASGAAVAEVPSPELAVYMQDGRTGRLIRGNHLRTEENEVGTEIVRTQYFQVVDQDIALAKQAVGNRNLLHVYRMFPTPKKLVQKDEITFAAPDVLEQSGWAGLCRHLWPEARIAHIGPQTIALEPAHAP
jgi:hypothetical protein